MANTLGSDVMIKVTPEELYAKSQNISSILGKTQQNFQEMEDIINKTESYWIGEAGEAHRQMFRDMMPHIEEITKRITEHVRDLNEIAGVYQETEREIQEIAEQLPSDVII